MSLAYIDETGGRLSYLFRVDAGVFETETPGPLLELASHPMWLDSLASNHPVREQPLVRSGDSTMLWATARAITTGAYADTFVDYARRTADRWRARLSQGDPQIDLNTEMTRLTLEVVTNVLFDTEIEPEVRQIGRDMHTIVTMFDPGHSGRSAAKASERRSRAPRFER